MTQDSSIEIADIATTRTGVTYSVGTKWTPYGPRAIVMRTADGRSYTVKYAVDPANEKLPLVGTIGWSFGRKISVDNSGNVWVAMTAKPTTSMTTEYWAVTQLKPDLSYWGSEKSILCRSICGSVYADYIDIHDIQVNFLGTQLLVATTEGMDLFDVTPGLPLPTGVTSVDPGPDAENCGLTPTVLGDHGSYGFVAASNVRDANGVLLISYEGEIVACRNPQILGSISSIDVSSNDVVVYGKTMDSVAFATFTVNYHYLGYSDFQMVSVSEQAGNNPFVVGQSVSWDYYKVYGTFTVQGDAPATYIVEHDLRHGRSAVFSSLSNATTGAKSAVNTPLLARYGQGLMVAASFNDASYVGSALSARFTVQNESLLAAPAFPAREQNINVTYGQSNSVPVALATNAESYSLVGGSLPNGMNLKSNGELAGSPLATGNYTAQIRATNRAGSAETTLFIHSAAKTPGSPMVIDGASGYPLSYVRYFDGEKGSDKDVVSAHFTGANGATINQQCSNGWCGIYSKDLPENTDVLVSLTQSNDAGSTPGSSSVILRRNVLPEPHTNVVAKGGPFSASVSFTPSADMHGVEALTTLATVTHVSDKSVTKKYWGCSVEDCVLTGLPAGNGYVVTLTIVTEIGDVDSEPSAPFTVTEPAPAKKTPELATEDLSVPAHEDFVLPLVANGPGDIWFDVNYDDLPEGVDFDNESNSLVGAANVGTYVIGYTAGNEDGTTEGTVTITVSPSQLRAPGVQPTFNTYDRKFSVYPFYKRITDLTAADRFEWTSTVTVDGKESTTSGTCFPGEKCTLPNAVWGEDLTLTIKAIPVADSGDTESETNTLIVHVPDLPPAVPTGKMALERMPDEFSGTAVVMGHVRMKPSMKFPLTLNAAATVQVDATTSCDVTNELPVLRIDGPRNGCAVDPYVRVSNGEETVAVDDDGGAVDIPTGVDDDGNDIIVTFNALSSRLSTQVEPGEYTIEATSFYDQFKSDDYREENSDVEYDLWITIITTSAEADRLMKSDVKGTAYTETVVTTVVLESDPAKEVVVPADLPPAKSNTLPAPASSPGAGTPASNASAPAVVSLNVEEGPGKLGVMPATLGGSGEQVTVTASPGGRSCSAAPGSSCTISGLSPWITYTLTAGAKGSTNSYTTTAKPQLQLKAGSKVKVSSLGVSAAAKTLGLGLKKAGVRVSGNCTLNAARTSISVGKSGVCTVTAMTTQKSKFAGPPLTTTAAIK